MSQVEEERTEIFGDPEEDPIFTEQRAGMEEAKDKGFFGSLADSFTGKSAKQAKYEKTEQQVTAEEAKRINEQIRADNDRLRRVVEEAPGAFNSHIGYAPLLKADANPENSLRNNVLFAGKGEMGRMMGSFMQNSIMNAKEHRGTST